MDLLDLRNEDRMAEALSEVVLPRPRVSDDRKTGFLYRRITMTTTEKIWFVSDLHFSHKNILKYSTGRGEELGLDLDSPDMLSKHDEALIRRWNMTVGKHDVVYILGDLSFAKAEDTRIILGRLNGKKHLIIGNHDQSCRGLDNYFVSTSQIKEVTFKKTLFPFLDENMHCVLCHFPLMAWNRRMHGSCMVHGHLHGSGDDFNEMSEELRVDIGFDSRLADFGLVSLEQLYEHFKRVRKGRSYKEHIAYLVEKNGFRA
jgi:calcineurin-like phosphoesterase family protein